MDEMLDGISGIHYCCFSTQSADHHDCKNLSKSIRQSHNSDWKKINGGNWKIVRKHGELIICKRSTRPSLIMKKHFYVILKLREMH